MSKTNSKNSTYTVEFKTKAVKMYLSGEHGGINALTKELGLKSHSQIKSWIAKYMNTALTALRVCAAKKQSADQKRIILLWKKRFFACEPKTIIYVNSIN